MYTEEIVYGAYKFLDSLRETAKDMYKNVRAAVKQKMYRWKVPAVKRAAIDARKMHDTVSFEGVNLFKKIQRTATLLKNTVRDRSIAERQALITLARLQYAMRGKYIHKGGLSHYQLQMQYGTIVSNGVFALTQDWTILL